MKAKEPRVPLRQSGCMGQTLTGCPAYTRWLPKMSLLCLVVLGHFTSFPGRLHEVPAVGLLVSDCAFPCPVLTLNNDENTCRAALGLAENTGEKTEQNRLGFFAPVENRVFFGSLRRTQVNHVWSAGRTRSKAASPESRRVCDCASRKRYSTHSMP